MLVKCSNNTLCTTLTIGKEYLVIDEGDKYYVILDDLAKKTKATITELNYQLSNDFSDIKDFKIRKNSKGEIKEIIVKFKYE